MENRKPSSKRSLNKGFHSDLLELSDGKLHTEDGRTFNIHKIELVKISKYFERLFYGDFGKGRKDYYIPGIRGEVLGNILSYIAGEMDINVCGDNVCEVLIAADYLLFDDLIVHIKNTFMRDNLSVRNCFTLFLVAFQIQRQDMLDQHFRYTQTHFQSAVAVEDSDLKHLPLEALKMFLRDKNLCVEDENSVWLAITKWIEADNLQRQSLLPDLLNCLAVSDVDEQLATRILEHSIVSTSHIFEEINSMEQSSFQSNLQILTNYILNQPSSSVDSVSRRQPSHLYFITHHQILHGRDVYHMYTTYDEKLDLWREVVEVDDSPSYVFSIGHDICMMGTLSGDTFYNLIEGEWRVMPEMRVPRFEYAAAKLDGLIYVIGGIDPDNSVDDVDDVELYDHVSGAWRDVSPIMPSAENVAATLGRRIYIVGTSQDYDVHDMIAQKYEDESDSWIYIASPSVFRHDFALVAYRERLYLIGGWNDDDFLRSVEVFDPEKQEWETHKQLPYDLFSPKAIVLNDVLIVYEAGDPSPPQSLQWDIVEETWKPFEGPTDEVMCEYEFFTLDDRVCTEWITKQNKDPHTEFHRSPFS